MSHHPDNELRRKLWQLADKWHDIAGNLFFDPNIATAFNQCAQDLREVLTYAMADEADEQKLIDTYSKTSNELADEAEAGYGEKVSMQLSSDVRTVGDVLGYTSPEGGEGG